MIAAGAHGAAFADNSASVSIAPVTTSVNGSSFLVAVFSSKPNGATPIQDNFGNTYALVGSCTFAGGTLYSYLYVCQNGIGGAAHVFTFNATTLGTLELFAVEVTGGIPTGLIDESTVLNVTLTPYLGLPVTASNASELLLIFAAGITSASPVTLTDANGATTLDTITDGINAYPGFSASRGGIGSGAQVTSNPVPSAGSMDAVIWNVLLIAAGGAAVPDSYPLSNVDYF